MTDRNEERTFAALPATQGRGFAQTWWGRSWLKALEDAALDAEQVKTGRRLARAGAVGAVSVRPGRITAVIQDRDRTTHRADVLLQELSAEQWDRFLDMAVERAGHVAALLDREMPPHLFEDAAAAGVELLPGLGDLEAQCDCGAWDHCGHTAALCYQMARLLDQDPFALLLMRGRAERMLLDELQLRSSASAQGPLEAPGPAEEGVDAVEAYASGDILPPLPAIPPLPAEPGPPPVLDTEAAPAPGVDPSAMEFLAVAAAAEAHRLLAEARRPGHGQDAAEAELTLGQDAVRLAAATTERAIVERLANGSGRDRQELALAVHAWHHGGVVALAVLEDEWTVEADALARACAALESAWDEDERPPLRVAHNRWTAVGTSTQLRLGHDGRWWPYRKERGRWTPAGPPAGDPATALATAEGDPGGEPTNG
ncbi:SWF or SNF family helicase [Streptomyces sp. NBC_01136]|uniref:SWIM zinc finger family protein n=1 Tax=Streptomyces sp. NBC_01136 TaxID=2903754 RepID=UPI00386635E4|nr:SWF or SNF family helicase [Streptomyces sp. NBC_01136]